MVLLISVVPMVVLTALSQPIFAAVLSLFALAAVVTVRGRRAILADLAVDAPLESRRCPACASSLEEREPDDDGCIPCANCAAAWDPTRKTAPDPAGILQRPVPFPRWTRYLPLAVCLAIFPMAILLNARDMAFRMPTWRGLVTTGGAILLVGSPAIVVGVCVAFVIRSTGGRYLKPGCCGSDLTATEGECCPECGNEITSRD